jgi:hypothetical protein
VGLWVQPYVGVTCAGWYDAVMSAYLKENAADGSAVIMPTPSPWDDTEES